MSRQQDRRQVASHDNECAERLRLRRLVQAGEPSTVLLQSIAADIRACCGHHPLKCHRLAYGWSSADKAVRAVHDMCRDKELGNRGLTKRSWLDWESGKRPGVDYLDLLCRLFETGPVELGFGTDYTPTEIRLSSRSVETERATAREWELIMNAAHESSNHAADAEAAGIGPNAMEQLFEDVVRLARSYVSAPPLPLFAELAKVRDRAYWLLDQTRQPDQRRDLYLLAGQTCGLLASASFDLGYPSAASEQARAARTYGDVIGHPELRAWADGLLACIEFWAGRPSRALRLVERGLDDAPSGTPRIRLLCIGARAAAMQGDAAYVRGVVEASREATTTSYGMHDDIGGEFGFDQARQAFCLGSAYVALGRPQEAVIECRRALELYQQASPEQRWYAAEASASVDLASAHLLIGDVSGAATALGPVFGLPAEKRVEGLVKRVIQVRVALASKGGREAGALAEHIEHFSATSITRALPAGS